MAGPELRSFMAKLSVILFCLLGICQAEPLPMPKPDIPEMPPLQPTVITAGGERLLLNNTDVEVY